MLHHARYTRPLLLSGLLWCLAATRAAAQSEAIAPAETPASAPNAVPPATAYETEPATPAQVDSQFAAPATPSTASGPQGLDAPAPLPEVSLSQSELTIGLLRVEGRLKEVRLARDTQGIAGPIVLQVVGYSIGTFFALGTLASAFSLQDVNRHIEDGSYDELDDFNDDGRIDRRDRTQARRLMLGVLGVSLVHLGLGGLGTWWLTKRLMTRERLGREARGLETERKVLQIKLDVAADQDGACASVVGTF